MWKIPWSPCLTKLTSRIEEQTCKLHRAAEILSFDPTSKNPLCFSCDTEYKLTQTLGVSRVTDWHPEPFPGGTCYSWYGHEVLWPPTWHLPLVGPQLLCSPVLVALRPPQCSGCCVCGWCFVSLVIFTERAPGDWNLECTKTLFLVSYGCIMAESKGPLKWSCKAQLVPLQPVCPLFTWVFAPWFSAAGS